VSAHCSRGLRCEGAAGNQGSQSLWQFWQRSVAEELGYSHKTGPAEKLQLPSGHGSGLSRSKSAGVWHRPTPVVFFGPPQATVI